MEEVKFLNRKINQAYEQAPWRRQMQAIGIFLLVVVVVALISGVSLNITSRAATLGREIQDLTMTEHTRLDLVLPASSEAEPEPGDEPVIPIEVLKIEIVDLEAKLASLTATDVMRTRAERLGFQPVAAENIVYLEVPGYQGRSEAMLAPPTEPVKVSSPVMPYAYRESLLEWLSDEVANSWFLQSSTELLFKGVQP